MIVGGVGTGIYRYIKGQEQITAVRQAAQQAFEAGETAMKKKALLTYNKADFQEALKAFADVQKRFPNTKQAVQASVLEPICQAYVSMDDNNWEAAIITSLPQLEDLAYLISDTAGLSPAPSKSLVVLGCGAVAASSFHSSSSVSASG